MSIDNLPTYLNLEKPFWRSYFLPVFTRKQFFFLAAAWLLAIVLVFLAGEYGLFVAVPLVASSIGALSMSAPAILITSSNNFEQIASALQAGGWDQSGNSIWVKSGGGALTWENDRVRVINQPDVSIIFGPLFTLQRIKSIIRSQK